MLIFLSADSVLGEVFKLPVLIHHYFEHSTEDKELSILDFLGEHYSGEIEHHHKKGDHHEKLPFKSMDSHSVQVLSLIVPNLMIFKTIPDFPKRSIPIHHLQIYTDAHLDSIWQPPKFG